MALAAVSFLEERATNRMSRLHCVLTPFISASTYQYAQERQIQLVRPLVCDLSAQNRHAPASQGVMT